MTEFIVNFLMLSWPVSGIMSFIFLMRPSLCMSLNRAYPIVAQRQLPWYVMDYVMVFVSLMAGWIYLLIGMIWFLKEYNHKDKYIFTEKD